jgi:hypothetical protein
MDFMPQQIFCGEVERQCKFALMAYEGLQQALTNYKQPRPKSPAPNSTDAEQVRATMTKHDQWVEALAEHKRRQAAAADRFWFSVQAFLVAAGNISKLLWPPGKTILPERGPELRASLEVEEDSPLKPRTFRNHFEHFDDRLEQWAVISRPRGRVFIDANIGHISTIPGAELGDYLRNFDSTNSTVTFQGDSYHLPPIVEAIEQLRDKATVRLQQRASA